MSKITITLPAHAYRPGDEIRVHGLTWDGQLTESYIVASVTATTLTLDPNAFQRAWFWVLRQVARATDWMRMWDERFDERYEDRAL
jgi:hypothetical protein